jgi:hypothetical protein
MPHYEEYAMVPGDWIAPGDVGRLEEEYEEPEIGPERALEPLLELVSTPGHLGDVARDELRESILSDIASGDVGLAAKSFAFGTSVSKLGMIAKKAGIRDDLMPVMVALETAILNELESSGIVARELAKWSTVTFWTPIMAARRRLVSPEVAVSAGLAEGVMCTVSPLFHRAYEGDESDSVGVELLRAYIGLDSIYDRPAAIDALSALAHRFDTFVDERSFDPDWMANSSIEQSIVAPYFRAQASTHGVPGEEEARRATPVPSETDAAYAAAVILAAVLEFESWNLTDESDDQAALLRLGDLQTLEWVFVSRRIQGFEGEALAALEVVDFPSHRAELLGAWAERRLNLLDRSTFSRR